MNKHYTVLAAITLALGLGAATSTVYAQTTDADGGVVGYVVAFGSFIASGVFYSASGWVKNVRRKLAGSKVKIDYRKMGKDVAIGVLIGIGAFVYSTYIGETISILTPQQFLIQVGLNTSAILFVDKWILGRSEDPTKAKTG